MSKKISKSPLLPKEIAADDIIALLPGNIYWLSKDGTFLGCNNNMLKAIGLHSLEEYVGKTYEDLYERSHIQVIKKTDKQVMREDKSVVIEEVAIQPGKEPIVYLTKKDPLHDAAGNVIGLLGVSIDITERKKAEQDLKSAKEKAEVANKAKTEFLENMRHDIRTPLVGITGFAEIIKDEATDPKIKKYADNLIASSHTLLDLLNEVLEAAKVSSGEIPLLKKKFDLKKKLNEIILLNQAKAHQKNVDLSFDYDATVPPYVIGDPTRIHRIVLELITNALNFTHKGGVKLSVVLAKKNGKGMIIKIMVEDTGIGMTPEQQQEIYVQFKRFTPSYEGVYRGSGLGLFIIKEFVDQMGGELYVESQAGKGSKFTLIIKFNKPLLEEAFGSEEITPAKVSKQLTPKLNIEEHIAGNTPDSAKNRILLVEDNEIAISVVTNMLLGMECSVDVATEGKVAVKLAQENRYDLIFMDIGLPDIDGYETTKRIRLNESNTHHVPIVALTAHVDEENKQRCIGSGMNMVLSKPLAKEKAAEILATLIPYRAETDVPVDPILAVSGEVKEEIVDLGFVEKQYGNKAAALGMLVMLVESLPKELAELNSAHEKADWSLIQHLAHKMKGGASFCGARRLQEACSRLESAVKSQKNDQLDLLYQQLLDEIQLVEKTVQELK